MLKIPSSEDPTKEQLGQLIDLYSQGLSNKALEIATQLLKRFPNSAIVYNIQGAVNASLQRFDLAIQCYLRALKIKPDYAQAYNNLGVSLRTEGQMESAIDSYKQALKIKPDYAQAYNNMGIALHEIGNLKAAEDNYRKALDIEPHYAEAFYNLGLVFQNMGDLEAAKCSYNQAIEIEPNYVEAYYNLGIVLQDQGEIKDAIYCYKKTLAINPNFSEARHLINSLTGNTTSSPPEGYVEKLFNYYAHNFEQSLVDKLKYQTPKVLAEIIMNQAQESLGSVLDLGCGTGLMGIEVSQYCQNLEGVDISQSMLEKAKDKKIYNKLFHNDIVRYLTTETLNFDYFISADVFVYMGELSDVFRLIKSRNDRIGRLVFSTEHMEKGDYLLQSSGRYSHSKDYIKWLCEKHNYRLSYFQKSDLRKEKGNVISGGLYLLEF